MASDDIAADDGAAFLTLGRYAYGFTPEPDELTWFAAEFRRTCAVMAHLREAMPELEQVSPLEFMDLVSAKEPSQ